MTEISDLLPANKPLGPEEVCYSWQDPVTRLHYHFAVERLAEAVKRLDLPVMNTFIPREHYEFVRGNRGLEEHRLSRLRKAKCFLPILMARWPDGSHLTLDGNHRTVVAYERGQRTISYQVAEPELWRQFIIAITTGTNDIPVHSGIG